MKKYKASAIYRQESKTKEVSTVSMGLMRLKEYDTAFVVIDVDTKIEKRKNSESVMIPVKTKKDIDALIKQLRETKRKL